MELGDYVNEGVIEIYIMNRVNGIAYEEAKKSVRILVICKERERGEKW